MRSGIYLKELNAPDILQTLQAKLPSSLQERWNRRVFGIRQEELRAINFNDFVSLIEEENRLVNDPLYSKEALSHI